MLLVNGDGGIGKTSLASEYYSRFGYMFQHSAWVLSERNIKNSLHTALKPAFNLSFDEQKNDNEQMLQLIQEMSNLNQPCLLVTDNANEGEDIERIIRIFAD